MTGFYQQTLAQLIEHLPVKINLTGHITDILITGIALDSREVRPGNIFVALTGGNTDGHYYIPSAIKNGAVAVVGTEPLEGLEVPYFQVEDSRLVLAHLAASFYQYPARAMTVIGVTGTDGKTTTTNLIYQILLEAGFRAGVISTVNAMIGDDKIDTGLHVTTPEAPEVQYYLNRMRNAGLTHVVLESTSHGLAQHRVSACEFDIGVVTNITHEHLDYHGSYEAYREAKARLFMELANTHKKERGNPRLAILNKDDQSYDYLKSVVGVSQIAYSLDSGVDLWAEDVSFTPSGVQFVAVGKGFRFPVQSSMMGLFNISNMLAALGATVVGLNIDPQIARRGIARLRGIPGRMEPISLGQDFTAIVDFAHTPNALYRALETARQLTRGRVFVIFGSAGLRDRQKRRMMAKVSMEMADLTFLTAEDPRTESLDDILAEMSDEASRNGGKEGGNYWRVPDRREAIRRAVKMAQPGDVVISCGKGHEQSMCFGETEYPWDDRTAMRAALAELLGQKGEEMPYLPT